MKCEKCGHEPAEKRKGVFLCSVCSKFAPSSNLAEYVKEKIDGKLLETFRKAGMRNIEGMQKKAKAGGVVNRAAFGYELVNKELIPEPEKKLIVQKIFIDFLEQNISLSQLAKKHGFSFNGLKKILRNFTYIGKVKFSGQIMQGKHEAIISTELFNKVQLKLEKSGIS